MRTKPLLDAVEEIIQSDENTRRFQTLYYILDILDTKTSALLTFNGIIIASLAILASDPNSALRPFFHVAMILPIAACGICFRVVSIRWPFLSYGGPVATEFANLSRVVDTRTAKYRLSWRLSVLSVVILTVMVLVSLLLSVLGK